MMSPIGIIDAGYDMDSGYVYAKFITGDIVLICFSSPEMS